MYLFYIYILFICLFIIVISTFLSDFFKRDKTLENSLKTCFDNGWDIEKMYGKKGIEWLSKKSEDELKSYYDKLLKTEESDIEFIDAMKEDE